MREKVSINTTLFTPSQLQSLGEVRDIADSIDIECYLVGGSVRDALLLQEGLRTEKDGITIKDLDIMCKTEALTQNSQLIKKLDEKGFNPVEMGFGTWTSKIHGEDVEFVVPRKEKYRKLSVKKTDDLIREHKDILFNYTQKLSSIPPIDRSLIQNRDVNKKIRKEIEYELEERMDMYREFERDFRYDSDRVPNEYKPTELEKGEHISWEEDANRRDFTLNTLYLGLNEKNWLEVFDPTQKGIDDLRKGVLVTPLDPKQTFLDDPSRLIRLARFKACKGFDIDKNTKDIARDVSSELIRVPFDKIRDDVNRGITCDGYVKTLYDLELLDVIIPELSLGRGLSQDTRHHKYDVLRHIVEVVESPRMKHEVMIWKPPQHDVEYVIEHEGVSEEKAVDLLRKKKLGDLRWAGLFHDIGKPFSYKWTGEWKNHDSIGAEMSLVVGDRLKLPKKEKFVEDLQTKASKPHYQSLAPSQQYISHMVDHHMRPLHVINDDAFRTRTLKKFIRDTNVTKGKYTKEWSEDVLMFSYGDIEGSAIHYKKDTEKLDTLRILVNEQKEKMTLRPDPPAITGKDLIGMGYKPSKIFGEIITDVQEKVDAGTLDRRNIKTYVKQTYAL